MKRTYDDLTTPGLVFRVVLCLGALLLMCLGTVVAAPIWAVIWLKRQVTEGGA